MFNAIFNGLCGVVDPSRSRLRQWDPKFPDDAGVRGAMSARFQMNGEQDPPKLNITSIFKAPPKII